MWWESPPTADTSCMHTGQLTQMSTILLRNSWVLSRPENTRVCMHTNRVQWEQYYTDERIRHGQRLLLGLLWLEHQTFSCQSRPFLCLQQCMSHTDTILMHLSTVMSYKLHYCKLHNICKHACTVCMHVRTLVYWYIPFSCIQCKPHSRWGSVFPWQPVCS